MIQVPLFPLGTVLCPGIALPLHVFEPRYRHLTERCLARNEPFGVVLIREGREVGGGDLAIAAIGTLAEIRQARRLPDGRFELLVVGSDRFAINDVDTVSEPYLVAAADRLDEEVVNPIRAAQSADRVMRRFVRYLRLLRPMAGETAPALDVQVELSTVERDPQGVASRGPGAGDAAETSSPPSDRARDLLIPDDPTILSHLISGIVQVDSLRRQLLLEAPTTEDRLDQLERLLAIEIELLAHRLRPYMAGGLQSEAPNAARLN
jgi:Lon protease-like protein